MLKENNNIENRDGWAIRFSKEWDEARFRVLKAIYGDKYKEEVETSNKK